MAHGDMNVPCSKPERHPLSSLDLLGRAEVTLDRVGIREMIRGRRVLVTGAGGTIGAELCRQILTLEPCLLILCDRAEPRLFDIVQQILDPRLGRAWGSKAWSKLET